jgi:hypothetical protein
VAEGAPGFSLLEAEFVNHRYEPHFHDELVVAVTESGTAQINCWGKWFKAGPGAIFLSNPKDPQAAMTSETPWKYRAFYLSRTALDQTARVLGLPSFPRLNYGVFQSPGRNAATCFLSATTSGKSLPTAASRDIDCPCGSR